MISDCKGEFYAQLVSDLPEYHRDPFKRMIIAQAKFEGMTIIIRGSRFKKYRIPTIKV